ncbi:hypothetical protein D0817_17725 [Flavobacterium cupreum]|uniref:Uncharacterized protein n=1 Tax=Flavobacterium cupreum TaxID=2133766 RepID=A0A434A3Q5_9FLAO|nr:hypothetical protein [Flavobacterium cupreum]RUT69040.1 hypothetical protein D0817_17725 [Flavobacterium cupreum]
MRKTILSLAILSILFAGSYLFYDFKINKTKKEYFKPLRPKDFDPKAFIQLFTERYKEDSKLNFVTMTGEFPDNWVKPQDVEYLISIMYSKQKCCGYMNIFSSNMLTDNAEVGGFAIIFLNSYISKTKINLGLNSNPKTDIESIKKIEKWHQQI